MLQTKAFVKKTRRGKVLRIVREHYLRDDIWSGSVLDSECDAASAKLSANAPHYLVIDTNVALHQLDFLEHSAIEDVVLLSVVLQEVRHQNSSAYQRLRALAANQNRRFYVFTNEHHRDTYVQQHAGESANDRNDRAIRVATAWYRKKIPNKQIILLTDDAANRGKAIEEGIQAMSVQAYAAMRADAPELADIVAQTSDTGGEEERKVGRGKKRAKLFAEHKPMSEITAGIKANKYHQGALRVNRFNPFEGWVGSDSVGQDILISGRVDMNRAMDGDIVAVELLPESEWKTMSSRLPTANAADDAAEPRSTDESTPESLPGADMPGAQVAPDAHYGDELAPGRRPTGRVVGVIKRNWRSRGYCGSIRVPANLTSSLKQTTAVLFEAVDRRVPFIRIHTRQAAQLSDKRIVVVIDTWDVDSAYPSGHYVRTLGVVNDKMTETDVLLLENDINTNPFTREVHACVPPLPWSVTDADRSDPNRMDLRDRCICSVDPPGCKDIDDALHVRMLPNGNVELGVHIADVTHFLKPNTAMDAEASVRGTTVYLVQRRIDMLPKPLTEDICSLRSNVERLAFSVLWEVTPDVQVVNTTFTKSLIKSRAALTYAEAQSRIDDERLNDEITLGLRELNRIGKILRKRRADNGALQLASPEVRFEIDTETHDPLDVGMYQVREANQMVEEMMLLANCTVAEHILRKFPACALLRRHATPAPRQFEPLLRAAAAAGIHLNVDSSKALAESLDEAVRSDDPYFNKLVRIMATRCMTQATYFGSGDFDSPQYHHYGLATPLYTHFTSPIRRYADVIVHRLLAASLGLIALPETMRDRDGLRALTDNLNLRHRNAQLAGRSSVELHTVIFFRNRETVADARVTKVKANGMIIFVPKYGIEGPAYLEDKSATGKQGEWVLDEEKQVVVSPDGARKFTIFDKVAVRITVETDHNHKQQLRLALVDRSALPSSEQVS